MRLSSIEFYTASFHVVRLQLKSIRRMSALPSRVCGPSGCEASQPVIPIGRGIGSNLLAYLTLQSWIISKHSPEWLSPSLSNSPGINAVDLVSNEITIQKLVHTINTLLHDTLKEGSQPMRLGAMQISKHFFMQHTSPQVPVAPAATFDNGTINLEVPRAQEVKLISKLSSRERHIIAAELLNLLSLST